MRNDCSAIERSRDLWGERCLPCQKAVDWQGHVILYGSGPRTAIAACMYNRSFGHRLKVGWPQFQAKNMRGHICRKRGELHPLSAPHTRDMFAVHATQWWTNQRPRVVRCCIMQETGPSFLHVTVYCNFTNFLCSLKFGDFDAEHIYRD